MSSTLLVIAGVAIVVYTIVTQVRGTALRAKRLVILPAIITIVGAANLLGKSTHPSGTDVALIVVGAVVAAGIGMTLGASTRLERRDGGLWGQLPRWGLLVWLAFFVSRGALIGIAAAVGAHVADGTHAELLILGLNRVGQAVVIGGRAWRAGIPFTPEKDGSSPLGNLFRSAENPPSQDQPDLDPEPDPQASRRSTGSLLGGGLLGGGLRGGGPLGAARQDRRSARRTRRRR